MIDIVKKTITLHGKTELILEFRVYFMTPFGLIEDLEVAVKRCAALDLEPALNIRPVTVAACESLYEVIEKEK